MLLLIVVLYRLDFWVIIKTLVMLTGCFCLFIFSQSLSADDLQVSDLESSNQSNQKYITLGALQFPPMAYSQAGSQECIGYLVELTRQIFAEYGYEVRSICAPAIRVYRMIESGDVDFTVNIRSTKLLEDHADFFATPFGTLDLLFLSHKDKGYEKMVSAIRGFDYHGHRQKLVDEGYVFQDMPGSIDAIKMFVRERTRHLITYKEPYKFYLEQNGFDVPEATNAKFLLQLPTYYAVSNTSKNHDLIMRMLKEHVNKTQVDSFEQLMAVY